MMAQQTRNDIANSVTKVLEIHQDKVTESIKDLRKCFDAIGNVNTQQLIGVLAGLQSQAEDLLKAANTGLAICKQAMDAEI